jgi:hypothetical protein
LLAICLCAVRKQRRGRYLDLAAIELLALGFIQKAIKEDFDVAKHGPSSPLYCYGFRSFFQEANRCPAGA